MTDEPTYIELPGTRASKSSTSATAGASPSGQRARAIAVLSSGGSRADAARAAGVDRATITRWFKDPEFAGAVEASRPEVAELAVEGLEDLVPKALKVLEDALTGDKKVTAQMARVALDTVKSAASITGPKSEGGTFLAKLRELDANQSTRSD